MWATPAMSTFISVRSFHVARGGYAKATTSSDLFGAAFDFKRKDEKEVATEEGEKMKIVVNETKMEPLAPTVRTAATAKKTKIGTSVQKMKEVCQQVHRMHVDAALDQLYLNNRRVANEVRKVVLMAKNNAIHLGLPADELVISHYVIGTGTPLKRMDIKARGRGAEAIRRLPKSHLSVTVSVVSSLTGKKWEQRRRRSQLRQRYADWRKGANSNSEAAEKEWEKVAEE